MSVKRRGLRSLEEAVHETIIVSLRTDALSFST